MNPVQTTGSPRDGAERLTNVHSNQEAAPGDKPQGNYHMRHYRRDQKAQIYGLLQEKPHKPNQNAKRYD